MPRQAGSCRSCRTLGLPMLRIEPLRSWQCVVGCSARELAVRQPTALTKHCAVPVACALSGSRLVLWSWWQVSRCAGPVTSALRAWLHRGSSLALPQAAEPGRGSVQAPASPVPVASVRLGCRLSHTSAHVSPTSRLRLRSGLTRRSSGQPPAGGVGARRGVHLRRCLPLNSNVRPHANRCRSVE